jgi:hypothetical protein
MHACMVEAAGRGMRVHKTAAGIARTTHYKPDVLQCLKKLWQHHSECKTLPLSLGQELMPEEPEMSM